MSIEEIKSRFPGDVEATTYFENIRWGNKQRCAYCDSDKISSRQADNRFHCSSCRRTFSVTAGTSLHGSKIPLRGWLYAFGSLSGTTGKFSIKQLQRDINVSYTTAWQMYQDLKSLLPKEDEKVLPANMFEYLCNKAIAVQRTEAPEKGQTWNKRSVLQPS
jgi:transposase-like protein